MSALAASAVQQVDWAVVAVPSVVAVGALVALVLDLVVTRRRGAVVGWASVAVLLAALAAAVAERHRGGGTFCLSTGRANDCSFVLDRFTTVLQVVMLGGALVCVLLSFGPVRRARIPVGEYHFLMLASVAGAVTLAGARDLLTLVVALETVSLPSFALVGLRRYDGRSAEAALKLFLVSVVSSAVMLLGVALVYGGTGQVTLAGLGARIGPATTLPAVRLGVVLAVAGFAFKVAAVPFHFWAPETYVGAPLPVATFLSVVSKTAGFAGLLLVLLVGFPGAAGTWSPALAVVAVLTMSVGNVAALRARRAVRLLAWSSVAQSGYMLLPLGALAGGHLTSLRPAAAAATVGYVVAYAVVNLGAFAVVAVVVRRHGDDDLGRFRGLARSRPFEAAALGFALLGLAGLPPGVLGLLAKVDVMRSPVAGHAPWLAVVMAVNVVVGLAYYLRWGASLVAAETAASAEAGADAMTAEARGGPADGPARLAVGLTFATAVVLSVAPAVALDALGPSGAAWTAVSGAPSP